MQVNDNLDKIFEILPLNIAIFLQNCSDKSNLIEIILDLGRIPEGRFSNYSKSLSSFPVTFNDLEYCLKSLNNFNEDNRTGIPKTLHRISCIRNKKNTIIGLTIRVGRFFYGNISVIRDLIELKKSILFLGSPGVGKTTLIREIANIISIENKKRVVIVDTSNEIAGDNDIPNKAIGKARRLQVQQMNLQADIMIEAVENHMPQVIIIDEIGTELEVSAAQTIAERGVQLIATAHGYTLVNLLKNPILSSLIGGLDYVTLSDEEAKRANKKKTTIERKGLATFNLVIELNKSYQWTIYENIEMSIDNFLENFESKAQVRDFQNKRKINISLTNLFFENAFSYKEFNFESNFFNIKNNQTNYQIDLNISDLKKAKIPKLLIPDNNKIYIYCYFFNFGSLLQKKDNYYKNKKFIFTTNIYEADIIIALNSHIKNNLFFFKFALSKNIPFYILSQNNSFVFKKMLREILK